MLAALIAVMKVAIESVLSSTVAFGVMFGEAVTHSM